MLSRLTFTLLMCLPLHQALAQDACDPNPCTSPPPDECDPDGVTLWTYPPEGGCTDQGGGTYNCDYTPMFTDCSAQGMICESGACVEPPACDPNPCTSPPPDECDPDGVTLWTYPPEGGCTDQGGGTYNCDYTPMLTDCSAQGKTCADGVCLDQPAPALSRGGFVLLGGLLAAAAYWRVGRRREPA